MGVRQFRSPSRHHPWPTTFLVNDVGKQLTSETRLFADDCAIYRKGEEANLLQKDLDSYHITMVIFLATPFKYEQMQGPAEENNSTPGMQYRWSIPQMGGLLYVLRCDDQQISEME